MRCKQCGTKTRVLQTLPLSLEGVEQNLRKRRCPSCKLRLDTMEKEISKHVPTGKTKSGTVPGGDARS